MTKNTHMRVLVVLPFYGGSLPIGRYCAAGLIELGHTVEVFESPAFKESFFALRDIGVTKDRLDYLEASFLNVVGQAILAKVETFEPDLVLALAQAPLNHMALKRLSASGVTTAMWFVEDHRLFTYWQAFAPFYDFFAVIQKEPFLSELTKIGVKNTLYLPLAGQPDFHKPVELNIAEKRKLGSSVSFIGAGYPNRRKAFKEIIAPDFKIWGNDWDGETSLSGFIQRLGTRIDPAECVRIFNASAINLNLHSGMSVQQSISKGDFVNPRTFELAMCGAFQLTDSRSLLPELFSANEICTFETISELNEKIHFFLENPEKRKEFSQNARERALQEHTYAQRMETLLNFISSRKDNWPKPRKIKSALTTLPDEQQEEIRKLLEDLRLPEDVSFPDLVYSLRKRAGKLSVLETSILFLDELHKQYSR